MSKFVYFVENDIFLLPRKTYLYLVNARSNATENLYELFSSSCLASQNNKVQVLTVLNLLVQKHGLTLKHGPDCG